MGSGSPLHSSWPKTEEGHLHLLLRQCDRAAADPLVRPLRAAQEQPGDVAGLSRHWACCCCTALWALVLQTRTFRVALCCYALPGSVKDCIGRIWCSSTSAAFASMTRQSCFLKLCSVCSFKLLCAVSKASCERERKRMTNNSRLTPGCFVVEGNVPRGSFRLTAPAAPVKITNCLEQYTAATAATPARG